MVAYPQVANVEERIADFDHVGERKVKMSHKYVQTDGVEVMRVYGNVLITSFPLSISEDETEFAFSVNIQRDTDGHYYRDWIIRN